MQQIREDQSRQAVKDAEYFRLCKEHNITPEPPRYSGGCPERNEGLTDAMALEAGELPMFPSAIGNAEEDCYERPEFKIPKMTMTAFCGVLEILTPGRGGLSPTAVKAAGRKVIVLSWMIGRGDFAGESLNFIADQIGCTRAALSHTCRQIEDGVGLRGRGQKSVAAQRAYSDSRKRVVARQQAEKQALRMPEDCLSE